MALGFSFGAPLYLKHTINKASTYFYKGVSTILGTYNIFSMRSGFILNVSIYNCSRNGHIMQ